MSTMFISTRFIEIKKLVKKCMQEIDEEYLIDGNHIYLYNIIEEIELLTSKKINLDVRLHVDNKTYLQTYKVEQVRACMQYISGVPYINDIDITALVFDLHHFVKSPLYNSKTELKNKLEKKLFLEDSGEVVEYTEFPLDFGTESDIHINLTKLMHSLFEIEVYQSTKKDILSNVE